MTVEETKGIMVASSTNSSEDSGYDNGFLSDSSTSSGTLDSYQRVCVLVPPSKSKDHSKDCHHSCALNNYDISGNGIEIISSRTFQYLSNCVKVLNLSKNKLTSLPESFCQLRHLEELHLSQNGLKRIPESWKVFHKLKVLNLSGNCLSEIPECLKIGMERLTHIDLSNNKISTFVDPPLSLPLLQCLNLSHNSFSSLPMWLFSEQCRSLLELDMSFNFCLDNAKLCSQISVLKYHRTSALKSLKKIDISNSGSNLEMINCLSHFESLESFFIGNVITQNERTLNYFWDVPVSLFCHPLKVAELHLPKVGLSGLPEDFYRLENLKVLDLSDNMLDWLPDTFGMLKSLQELIMTNCNLAYLPENFSQLTNLKKILFSQNKLTDVRNQLTGLSSLKWLDLYGNFLEEFPLSPSHLKSLSKLDVAANYVDVEVALDYEVDGESLLETYARLQKCLRESDVECSERLYGHKSYASSYSQDSSEPNSKRHYTTDEDSFSNADVGAGEESHNFDEEENWEDDFTSSNDFFDPNLIERYYLPPGQYRFGWTPPLRRRECQVPLNLLLGGFIFVPGASHTRSSRTRRAKVKNLPTVEGQFADCEEEDTAALHLRDTLWGLLKQMNMFVRNPTGPTVRRCRFCSIYDDCWHRGFWIGF